MPRAPRLVVAGYPHHVILRGNNKSAVFFSDKDRRFFIDCLKESMVKEHSRIYAYCLMTNHVHLLVAPFKEDSLAAIMQSLGRRYVRYVNSNHNRTGTLWEGRYKSSLVDTDKYLLACSRYIELNPVRAKIVRNPTEYNWSSYRFKDGSSEEEFIDMDPSYLGLGSTKEGRQEKYKKFVSETVSDSELRMIRSVTQRCGIMGTSDFSDRVCSMIGRKMSLKPRGRPKKLL